MTDGELERRVVELMLTDKKYVFSQAEFDWSTFQISERSLSGVGFLSQLMTSERLRVLDPSVSMVWSRGGAYLNEERIECGFLVYIKYGMVDAVEGFTFGREWPAEVSVAEMFLLDL